MKLSFQTDKEMSQQALSNERSSAVNRNDAIIDMEGVEGFGCQKICNESVGPLYGFLVMFQDTKNLNKYEKPLCVC